MKKASTMPLPAISEMEHWVPSPEHRLTPATTIISTEKAA